MMKQESNLRTRTRRALSPPAVGEVTAAAAAAATKTTTTAKRSGLWRMRSQSEAPPRSPITKAFDFLPWTRGKRSYQESNQAKTQSPDPVALNKKSSDVIIKNDKNDIALNYHRNIFRNGGGLIRDILTERLQLQHKDKENNNNNKVGATQPQALPLPPPLSLSSSLSSSSSARKLKKVVSRNKSLDINELITNVENDLRKNDEGTHNGKVKQRFYDDTFVENILRDKPASSAGNVGGGWYNDSGDDDDVKCSDIYDADTGFYQRQKQASENALRSSFHGNNTNGNSNSNSNSASNTNTNSNSTPKHILFNDENVVYLIKKESPVKRHDASKCNILESSRNSSKPVAGSTNNNALNMRSNDQNNVVRARLKFQKLPSDSNFNTLSTHAHQPHHNHHSQSGGGHQSRRPVSMHQLMDSSQNKNFETNETGSGKHQSRRGILQRQNTSPALGDLTGNNVELSANQAISRRRQKRDQLYLDRRQSLSEMQQTSELFHQQKQQQQPQQQQQQPQQQQQQQHGCCKYSSSSSSMGSAVSCGNAAQQSHHLEQPKAEKPRKKLSFREPIVTEKDRRRRLSSPLRRASAEPERGINAAASNSADTTAIIRTNDKRISQQHQNTSLNGTISGDAESQAMRIVRTVGQAFEVCHKFNFHKSSVDHNDEQRSDVSSELLDVERLSEQQLSDEDITAKKEPLSTTDEMSSNVQQPQRPNHLDLMPRASPSASIEDDKSMATPSSPSHEISKLKDQLEQQALQTRQALAQLMLVREQLISETNARIEAQARTQQLLQQNRELLEHLASLGAYNEQQTAGLTSANIAMAPQSQLQMLLQATSNNNNLATINQQISNLGSINQQLTSLSHQLSGLNQQSQNLQNFQNIQSISTGLQQKQQQQQQQTSTQQQQGNITPFACSLLNTPASSSAGTLTSPPSPYPSMNQLQNISTQLQQINAQATQHQLQQDALSKDLMQVNQDLLNRLQALNLGTSAAAATSLQPSTTPNNSFFFVNPMSCSPQATNNNNSSPSNLNFLSSGGGGGGGSSGVGASGTLTPSPMSTLNRNSYTHSPIADLEALRLSVDKNLNRVDEYSLLGQKLPSVASNGNIAACSTSGAGVGGGAAAGGVGTASAGAIAGSTSGHNSNATTSDNSRSTSTIDSQSSPRSRSMKDPSPMRFNTVTLKVTDEAGNVTNQRKLSATPSFITRSTSEKVPNRSQMMSEVQRTTWARHTTK